MTQAEAEALAHALWGPKGWADHAQGMIWQYGVGAGDRTFGTGDTYDEAFALAKERLARESECPSVARLLT